MLRSFTAFARERVKQHIQRGVWRNLGCVSACLRPVRWLPVCCNQVLAGVSRELHPLPCWLLRVFAPNDSDHLHRDLPGALHACSLASLSCVAVGFCCCTFIVLARCVLSWYMATLYPFTLFCLN